MGNKLQKSVVLYSNSEEDIKKYPVSIEHTDFSHRIDEMVKVISQQRQYKIREPKGGRNKMLLLFCINRRNSKKVYILAHHENTSYEIIKSR
ncbi:hypothetical protein [Clostridium magnum]|uniref:Uncharacterized protein n=1 Tax=Clostridium magnum DSM 2767 TaxID=1121326 RepID=A0A162ST76_9CLOT|nr:hypothetical protein [Clostridium magnum]KZL91839.1 hypothetical protein CLMAG_16450 [Clostridium magnum DSM 2767]SHI25648.1 hypothetical protein SAMN02745944_03672 [Clostridium magnum DSM 2767]